MTAISTLLRHAITAHAGENRVALTDTEETLDYLALRARIDAAAAAILALGVARGEPVGLIAGKTCRSVATYFGAMQAGACVCFMEPSLTPESVHAQMAVVGMRHLIVDAAHWERFGGAMAGHAVHRLETLDGPADAAAPELGPDDKAMLLFTSGSTGTPKGVLLTHRGLVCNAQGVLRHTGITPADRLLHVMPLYHTNGINNQLITPFLAGASVHLVERFRAEEAVAALRTGGFTYMTGVPTIYARMLPHLQPGEHFPSLRFLRCGSAPISVQLHKQVEDAFGVPLIVSYGLSEATCTSTMNPPGARRIGSIGTVLAGQDVRLFDPLSGKETPRGGEGEIRIAGDTLMVGYLGEGVEQPIKDGWLRTGDLGRFDGEGYLSITGRIKDVIIRGGENISPALIERQLTAHPAIKDSCVVGAPDADLGEVPVAFVVLRDGEALDEAGLKGFVQEHLARTYMPARVYAMDALPINAVGKTDRKRLKQMMAERA